MAWLPAVHESVSTVGQTSKVMDTPATAGGWVYVGTCPPICSSPLQSMDDLSSVQPVLSQGEGQEEEEEEDSDTEHEHGP